MRKLLFILLSLISFWSFGQGSLTPNTITVNNWIKLPDTLSSAPNKSIAIKGKDVWVKDTTWKKLSGADSAALTAYLKSGLSLNSDSLLNVTFDGSVLSTDGVIDAKEGHALKLGGDSILNIANISITRGHSVSSGRIGKRYSFDNGRTWTGWTTVIDNASYEERNATIGQMANGRIGCFYKIAIPVETTGTGNYAGIANLFIYSDDRGQTWSTPDTIRSANGSIMTPHGRIVRFGDGSYNVATYRDTSVAQYNNYWEFYTTSNNGGAWTLRYSMDSSYSATIVRAEPFFEYIGSNRVILSCRNNAGNTRPLRYVSADNGNSWTYQGVTNLNNIASPTPVSHLWDSAKNTLFTLSFARAPLRYNYDSIFVYIDNPTTAFASSTAHRKVYSLPRNLPNYANIYGYPDLVKNSDSTFLCLYSDHYFLNKNNSVANDLASSLYQFNLNRWNNPNKLTSIFNSAYGISEYKINAITGLYDAYKTPSAFESFYDTTVRPAAPAPTVFDREIVLYQRPGAASIPSITAQRGVQTYDIFRVVKNGSNTIGAYYNGVNSALNRGFNIQLSGHNTPGMDMYVTNSSGVYVNILRLDSAGNVGIGKYANTTAGIKLDVQGAISSNNNTITGKTESAKDSSTKLASTQYVDRAVATAAAAIPSIDTTTRNTGLPNFGRTIMLADSIAKVRIKDSAFTLQRTTDRGDSTSNRLVTSKYVKADSVYNNNQLTHASIVIGDTIFPAPVRTAVIYGDSYMAGFAVPATAQRASTILCNSINYKEDNRAISGTTMQRLSVGDSSAFDRIYTIPRYTDYAPGSILVIFYGMNDQRNLSYDSATYVTQGLVFVDTAIARSWPAANILIGTPGHVGNITVAAREIQYNGAAKALAAARGCKIADFLAAEQNTGYKDKLLIADSIHLTLPGHLLLGKTLAKATLLPSTPNFYDWGNMYVNNTLRAYRNGNDSVPFSVQNSAGTIMISARQYGSTNNGIVRIGTPSNTNLDTMTLHLGGGFASSRFGYAPKFTLYGLMNAANRVDTSTSMGITPTSRGMEFINRLNRKFYFPDAVTNVDTFQVNTTSTFSGTMNLPTGGTISSAGITNNNYFRSSSTTAAQFSVPEGTGIPHALTFFGNSFTNVGNRSGIRTNFTYAPTTGTVGWAEIRLNSTINVTGTASGITAGIYSQPTITSLNGGTHYGFYSAGISGYDGNYNSILTSQSWTPKGYVDSIITAKVTSGTYTPTLTNQTNVSASSVGTAIYTRNGNVIHVAMSVNITPTASPSNTVLYFTLPVTGYVSGAGVMTGGSVSGYGVVLGVNSSTAQIVFQSQNTGSNTYYIQFDYTL
jgi:hypothetical protein